MGVKKAPATLYSLCLQKLANILLDRWNETYENEYSKFSKEIKQNIGQIIPYTIYDQMFDIMVDSQARLIQREFDRPSDAIPRIASLIDTLLIPNLRKLNLNGLHHMGRVKVKDIVNLELILLRELPNLGNLVEISLRQNSGTDYSLPTCSDEILDKIGNWCPNLRTLDVSYNYAVTDVGLACLIPSESHLGCPLLTKITLFECTMISSQGTSKLLKGLPRLKFLGYRESGLALLHFNKTCFNSSKKLELAHVNNLGTNCRPFKDFFKLKCDEEMVNVIVSNCPKLSELKVRVCDLDVKFLQAIKSVDTLELVYNLGSPMSPGQNTLQYLLFNGSQFVSLSFVCDVFTTHHLKVVCEQCINLKRFWIRSNRFVCDHDLISSSDRKKCSLNSLEVFFLRVGSPVFEVCHIPHNVISYILHKSTTLFEVSLAMKNSFMNDSFVQQLFSSIQTSKIKRIMLLQDLSLSTLSLSMASVESLMGMCPQLEQLGDLVAWDVYHSEIQDLRHRLKLSNSALILIYKF